MAKSFLRKHFSRKNKTSKNNVGVFHESIKNDIIMLNNNDPKLTTLIIDSNKFDDKGAIAFAEALKKKYKTYNT